MANYITNSVLLKEIIASKEAGELTPPALQMLCRIAQEISKTMSYKYAEDRDDCMAFAIEDILRYWKGFDENISRNAFAYYSQMTKHGLAKGYKKLYGNIPTTLFVSISNDAGISNI